MNIALEQSEEWVEGTLTAKYGDCFLRGNNGACVCRDMPPLLNPPSPRRYLLITLLVRPCSGGCCEGRGGVGGMWVGRGEGEGVRWHVWGGTG